MELRAIALDLDGTLLNSAKEVSARNRAAVLRVLEKGLRVIIATARPPRSVAELLPSELLERASIVCYNGAIVRDRAAGIDEHYPMTSEVTAEVIRYCGEYLPTAHLSVEVNDKWYANRDLADGAFYHPRFRPELATYEVLASQAATKILLTEYRDAEVLRERFAPLTQFVVTDGGALIQMMNPAVSKTSGILRLCGHFGIQESKIAVFGDDHNDFDMFRMAGYSVAMGNAVQELKDIANETTASNDDDGVAVALERLLVLQQ
ncbi:HAD family hydrolase [Paenibacillus sp. PAMC21692]|uniref:HAD family hydrolase n=1 Tax=Paenibacillus sp. PAMC21692 TaxID=2762320 RepID=UPI00164CF479|nr:HAD family hydrolase [Paenibacillus sp. PAMC21692]QNK58534.1 HAD family hydrolase [Paenibacillus sp. PAMC21692]